MAARERKDQKELENKLREIGPSQAVDAFLSQYGNVRTKSLYAVELALYLRWLNAKGIVMTPDELVKDNLVRVFKSDPTDVPTKKYHTSLLNEYINRHLLSTDCLEAKRKLSASAIMMFYRSNDSELFGHFHAAERGARGGYPETEFIHLDPSEHVGEPAEIYEHRSYDEVMTKKNPDQLEGRRARKLSSDCGQGYQHDIGVQ
jgi:hypothetical protein